jgi:hypothetical protein
VGRRRHPAAARGSRHATALLQRLVRELLETRDGTTYAFERLSGASIRHDLGGDHGLVGRVAPEFRFEDGSRLAELMRDGEGVLLDFERSCRVKRRAGRDGSGTSPRPP